MKVTNEAKAIEQALVLQKWGDNDYKGTWIAFTGVGKTRVGVLAASTDLSNPNIVIVPTENLRDNEWEREFDNWSSLQARQNCEIVCIQSAYKYSGKHYGTVVVDECHTTLSDNYRLFFKNNTFDRILSLTATEPESDERLNFLITMAPVIHRTPRERAIELKLVSDSMVFNLGVELSVAERKLYDSINAQYSFYEHELGGPRSAFQASSNFLKFQKIAKDGGNVVIHVPQYKVIWRNLIDGVTIRQSDCREITTDELVTLKKRIHQSRMYWEHLRQRKEVCQRAVNKQGIAKQVYDRFPNKRAILFSPTIEVANRLQELCGDTCGIFHSKVKKDAKTANLIAFGDGSKRGISTVKALNAGMDVPECDLGINLTNDSKQLQQIQKTGRTSRFKDGKIAYFVNIYCKDTQEAVWLSRGTYNMEPKWITNINELPIE